ncbi:MAG: hypothetical protein JXR70_04390 [Spirochaetales bacterium]|nr:hypothetical protein [Spirochaetales bacterium]
MKKTVFIILCLVLSLSAWSGGTNENNPPVSEKASWLIGVDIQSLLTSPLFESVFRLFPFFRAYGLPESADFSQLNLMLKKNLGFTLNEINTFYLWNNELSLPDKSNGFGYIIGAANHKAESLLNALKAEQFFSVESESSQELVVIEYFSRSLYFVALGPFLCFSEDRGILKQMITAFQNNSGIKANKSLYPMFQKYSSESVFICADLKDKKAEWLVPPLDMMELFSASISVKENIIIQGVVTQSSEKSARQFYNLFSLALNLVSQIVPPDRPELKEAYRFMMKPLKIRQQENRVLMDCEYSNDILIHLKKLLDFGLELLYSGY